jgi:hypothetical protein
MADELTRVTSGNRTLVYESFYPKEIEVLENGATLTKLVPKVEFQSACFSPDGSAVFVGGKNIVAFDLKSGKKTKLAFKGHRATPNALLVEGGTLYSAGGSYIYTDDRFVRTFDAATGEAQWKLGGKNAGFEHLAMVNGFLLASAENARLYAIRDGEVVSEVAVAGGGNLKAPKDVIWLGPTITGLSDKSVEWYEGEGQKAISFTASLTVDAKKGTISLGTAKKV